MLTAMSEQPWTVEISPEVEKWYATLRSKDQAAADRAFDRLADHGPNLRMPHSRALGGDLFELASPVRTPPDG